METDCSMNTNGEIEDGDEVSSIPTPKPTNSDQEFIQKATDSSEKENDDDDDLAITLRQLQVVPHKKRRMDRQMMMNNIAIDDPFVKQLRLLKEKYFKNPMKPFINTQPSYNSDNDAAVRVDLYYDDYVSEEESEVKKSNKEKGVMLQNDSKRRAYELPYDFKKVISFIGILNSDPQLVIEKILSRADVDEKLNRLSIPQRKIKGNFLDVEEEELLNRDKWIMVEIIEPNASVSMITLSKWETKNGISYVLITEWNGVVNRNQLHEGIKIQLWCFRVSSIPRFALCYSP